jgi:hypothetical protein
MTDARRAASQRALVIASLLADANRGDVYPRRRGRSIAAPAPSNR